MANEQMNILAVDYPWRATNLNVKELIRSFECYQLGNAPVVESLIGLQFSGFETLSDLVTYLEAVAKFDEQIEPFLYSVFNRVPYLVVTEAKSADARWCLPVPAVAAYNFRYCLAEHHTLDLTKQEVARGFCETVQDLLVEHSKMLIWEAVTEAEFSYETVDGPQLIRFMS